MYVHRRDGDTLYIATVEASAGYNDWGVVRLDYSGDVLTVERYVYWSTIYGMVEYHDEKWDCTLVADYEDALADMGYTEYRTSGGELVTI